MKPSLTKHGFKAMSILLCRSSYFFIIKTTRFSVQNTR